MAAVVAPAPTPMTAEALGADTTAAASTLTGEAASQAHLEAKEHEAETGEPPLPVASDAAVDAPKPAIPPSDPAPSTVKLDLAKDMVVFDKDGVEYKFGSLYAQPGKHLIILVRHFLCGLCEDFTREFSRTVPPSRLPRDTTVHFVGCGDPSVIPSYVARTACPYPLFADPTQKLYHKLGMISNLRMGEQRPKYQINNTAKMVAKSLRNAFGNLSEALKSGPSAQLGGEMVIETGADGASEVVWCHWMRHTRNHREPEEIAAVLGLA